MAWTNPTLVRDYAQHMEGKPVRVTIEPITKKRSNNQNRYWWGVVIAMLSEQTGYEKDEMNSLLEYQFLRKEVEIEGEVYAITQKAKGLDTKSFNQLIEDTQRWAAETFDLYIPSPDENDYFL